MATRQHVSKVFLDSRYVLPDGTFAIPGESILLTPDTRCWLSEFTAVCSWDTLDSSNRLFQVVENGTERLVGIPAGPHDLESLRAAMEAELNGLDKTAGVGDYTVERVSTATGGSTFRAFQVSLSSGTFAIPFEFNTLRSIVDFPTGDTAAAAHKSGFVDVRRVHNIFLHTRGLGNNSCVTPTGSRSVLAKIPVLVGYGGLIHYTASGLEADFVECGSSALSTLRVELRDAAGRQLDLKGTSFSLTLVFERRIR
jgi:hypothetical protein